MRNFVKCFLEIEKDGVCLYSIIDIVCEIVFCLLVVCLCRLPGYGTIVFSQSYTARVRVCVCVCFLACVCA